MKPGVISMLALAVAAAGGCGGGGLPTRPATDAGGTGGGAGGTAGAADAGRGGRGGAPDAGAGGSNVVADAGRDSSDVAADAGAPDAGDGRGGSVTDDGMLCPPPARLITDFTYVPGGATTAVHFGNGTSLSGTEYVYPTSGTYPLTSDVTGNDWHISGTVGDYSGFGLTFDGCSRIDASAFHGISFTISGSVPQGSAITMGIGTLNDTLASSWLNSHGGDGSSNPGRCIPTVGTNRFTQTSCVDAVVVIPIQATPTVQTIRWTDFNGGRPEANVTASDILSFYWSLPSPTLTYPVDIVIDDLAFVP
jgi:hypothetical protein